MPSKRIQGPMLLVLMFVASQAAAQLDQPDTEQPPNKTATLTLEEVPDGLAFYSYLQMLKGDPNSNDRSRQLRTLSVALGKQANSSGGFDHLSTRLAEVDASREAHGREKTRMSYDTLCTADRLQRSPDEAYAALNALDDLTISVSEKQLALYRLTLSEDETEAFDSFLDGLKRGGTYHRIDFRDYEYADVVGDAENRCIRLAEARSELE